MTRPYGSNAYDVIVVGVGAMGSATCYYLAQRGKRVLGIERFGIPHTKGSSHGYTRIIRLAYYEHPSYVLLLRRAYELWRQIQEAAGEQLLHITGSIDAGPEDQWVFKGSWESCRAHDLPHEVLTGSELRRRYPGYHLPADTLALLQPDGGFLRPERCIVSYVQSAQALGATIHGHEQVLEWEPTANGVRVYTDRDVYEADKLVVSAGAWGGDLVDCMQGLIIPERQVLAWLQPTRPEYFAPGVFPVFNLLVDEGRFYGFPVFDVPGFKFGKYHHLLETDQAESIDRTPHHYDEQVLRQFAERYFPDGCGPTMNLETCIFTNTPDNHFLIDVHPTYPQVCFASPCSGHGFKFASVIGEILADLAEIGLTRHDISLFRLDRLLHPGGSTHVIPGALHPHHPGQPTNTPHSHGSRSSLPNPHGPLTPIGPLHPHAVGASAAAPHAFGSNAPVGTLSRRPSHPSTSIVPNAAPRTTGGHPTFPRSDDVAPFW